MFSSSLFGMRFLKGTDIGLGQAGRRYQLPCMKICSAELEAFAASMPRAT